MPSNCAVSTCKIYFKHSKTMGMKIAYYRFPKDIHTRKIWVTKCNRSEKFNVNTSRICSLHFTTDDFIRDLKSELLNEPVKLILKAGAIPSIKLDQLNAEEETINDAQINKQDKGERNIEHFLPKKVDVAKKTVEKVANIHMSQTVEEINMLNTLEIGSNCTITNKCMEVNNKNESCIEEEHSISTDNHEPKAIDEVDCLKAEIVRLKNENSALIKRLTDTSIELEHSRRKVKLMLTQKKRLLKLNKSKNPVPNENNNILDRLLTPAQIELLTKKKKIVHWKENDFIRAFTLRYFSKQAYIYLRENLNYPLPGISTLQAWFSKLDLEPGILATGLTFLKIAGQSMSADEKLVILQYDEVKVKEAYEYDTKHDRVIGPHSQMQVVSARGLFGKWRQPIYVGFDNKITLEILHNVINKMYGVGFTVVAFVSDCRAGNVELWEELGVNYENFFIKHQIVGSNIYFFADAPHLLKLVRNWFLDTGFIFKAKTINKEPIEELIAEKDSELNNCFKINRSHLDCDEFQRQNLTLASQLLSHTTSAALKDHFNSDDAIEVSNFIRLVDSWFGLMNLHTIKNSIPSKAAYGIDLPNQNNILDHMYNTILIMRCVGKEMLQIFQKGILMSINSLKSLLLDVKENVNKEYILTHRLNQDELENVFPHLQTKCRLDDHLTPLNALQRMKMTILGKSTQMQVSNTTDKNSDEFIIRKVLLQCDVNSIENVTNFSPSNDIFLQADDKSLVTHTENDGFEYLAGWMAKQLKKTHPQLRNHTYNFTREHDYICSTMLMNLPSGEPITPTNDFKAIIFELNREFLKWMGEGLKNEENISNKLLIKFQAKFPTVDEAILKLFIKQRILIRINFLNMKYPVLNQEKKFKRKVLANKQNLELGKRRKICETV